MSRYGAVRKEDAAASFDHNLFPSWPLGKIHILIAQPASVQFAGDLPTVKKAELHCWQSAGSRRKDHILRDRLKRELAPIHSDVQPRCKLTGLGGQITLQFRIVSMAAQSGLLHLLECRDLCHVDQVENFHRIALDCDPRVVTNAEVSHRMSKDCSRAKHYC
jgi:hypothetical protein